MYNYTPFDNDDAFDRDQFLTQERIVFLIRLSNTVLYGAIFIFGILGNCWVIPRVIIVLYSLEQKNRAEVAHIYTYVLALCIVDTLVLSIIPLIIIDINFDWLFGDAACKIFYAIENVNKFLSIFMLTALSLDRYFAVCHPFELLYLKSIPVVLLILAGCTVLSMALMSPVIWYTGTVTIPYRNGTLVKCMSDAEMPEMVMKMFISSAFLFGYCVPGALLVAFYSRLILVVARMRGQSLGAHHPQAYNTRQLVISVLRVVGFYFICWTPYWILTLLISLKPDLFTASLPLTAALLIIHALPFANSAGNWVFYALLNKQLCSQARLASTMMRERLYRRFSRPTLEPLTRSRRHTTAIATATCQQWSPSLQSGETFVSRVPLRVYRRSLPPMCIGEEERARIELETTDRREDETPYDEGSWLNGDNYL